MIPKEKAKQLYELTRYDVSTLKGTEALINEVAKRCALMTIDEILKITWVDKFLTVEEYWQEVKKEINNL